MTPHLPYIVFLFILGACVGSFINVVVWRYPTGGWKSLVWPPSHCPKCEHRLASYDNVPIFGWIFLRGKCRYCKAPISMRYPIVEFCTGALLAFYYIAFFVWHIGPCSTQMVPGGPLPVSGTVPFVHVMPQNLGDDWPLFALCMMMMLGLLAASLIDAEHFIIPPEIPWAIALAAFVVHAWVDEPLTAGSLNLLTMNARHMPAPTTGAALAAGGAIGLLISMVLSAIGIIPTSFAEGEPIEEADREMYQKEIDDARKEGKKVEYELPPPYTGKEVRAEIRKEILFLLPPVMIGCAWLILTQTSKPIGDWWAGIASQRWLSALLGSMLGAMVGAMVVWLARIVGTLALGRLAMGLGDVHLMFGVGAVIGAGASTVAFFLAPFAGLFYGAYRLFFHKRHELPLGPYLSLATGVVLLTYCPIAAYLTPGLQGLSEWIHSLWAVWFV